MIRDRILVLVTPAMLLAFAWVGLHAAPKKPVYVGVRVWAGCHAAGSMGNQYSQWLHSRHSQAYALLARPESLEIAKLSGLRNLPQESAVCLGCHATAWHAEEWEKDGTFHIEDGVQCEGWHGPGSRTPALLARAIPGLNHPPLRRAPVWRRVEFQEASRPSVGD